ncbi:MAG: hypothetical protein PUF72_02925 [Clostridiales bacterium]|nr:hypothetical protein [Clostridiales bacterium]
MQSVSQKWKDNQAARERKPGILIVDFYRSDGTLITYEDITGIKSITEHTFSTLDSVTRKYIKQSVHKRSYEPMGMQLPVNTFTLELYNFNDVFFDFYLENEQKRFTVKAWYGYELDGGNEIIKAGTWYTSKLSYSQNILTIEAQSLLNSANYSMKDDISITGDMTEKTGTVTMSYSANVSTATLNIIDYIKNLQGEKNLSQILNNALSVERRNGTELNVNINPADYFDSISATGLYYELSTSAIIQSAQNIAACRCIIDRDDIIQYSKNGKNAEDIIYRQNIKSKPEYTRARNVSVVSQSVWELGNTTNMFAENGDPVVYKTISGQLPMDYTLSIAFDPTSNQISEFEISMQSRYGTTSARSIRINSIRINENSGNIVMYVNITILEFPGVVVGNTGKIMLSGQYRPIISQVMNKTGVSSSPDGEICDIHNKIGTVVDTDKIITYYSNRDIYNIKMRGNPAFDIGDYLTLEMKERDEQGNRLTKEVLLLSSELTYNGAFTDNIQVRVIENQFEERE